MKRSGLAIWFLKHLGIEDAFVGDLIEQHGSGRSSWWLWRQVLMATFGLARTNAWLTLGSAVIGWAVLWVFFGVLLVPFAQLDGYVTAKGLAQPYSAGWWIRGILMWVVVGFPFVASGWIVAKIASRTPLLPVLTFAVSVSTVMLIALILDDPRQALDLRMWLTVPLFLVVAPATTIAASGFVAARRR